MIILVSMALAEPVLPSRPQPTQSTSTECAQNIALVPGKPLPVGLLDADGNVVCGAVAVPTSLYADHLNTDAAYDHLRVWTELELTRAEVLLEVSRAETLWWESKANEPLRIGDRPWFNQLVGAGTVLLGGAALALVDDTRSQK